MQAGGRGFNGQLVQMGERLACTQEAVGSNPTLSTNICNFCSHQINEKGHAGFCNRSCYDKFRYRNKRQVEKTCRECGKAYLGTFSSPSEQCPSCKTSWMNSLHSGEKSHTWKGGNCTQEGRFGRDPQGLSWKQQQRRAWERDNYSCQWGGCDKKGSPNAWKPHVHHRKPYRLFKSHELELLICYCSSHHRKAEALDFGMWARG